MSLVNLLRIIERRQMLFVGVTASLFTTSALLLSGSLRAGRAEIAYPVRPVNCDRVPCATEVNPCRTDPVATVISAMNSAEFNRRLTSKSGGSRVRAELGTARGRIEIHAEGANPRDAAVLANRAALEWIRLARQSEQIAYTQMRKQLERMVHACDRELLRASQRRNREDARHERVVAGIIRSRDAYRQALHTLKPGVLGPTPRIVAWAGYPDPIRQTSFILILGLLSAAVGTLAALAVGRRMLPVE